MSSRVPTSIAVVFVVSMLCNDTAIPSSWTSRLEPDSAVIGQAVQVQTQNLTSDYPNIRILPSNSFEQSEMAIAIDPMNPLILIVGANTVTGPDTERVANQGSYFSLDGGNAWEGDDTLPPSEYTASDPVVAINADGIVYFSFIEDVYNLGFWDVHLFKSLDHGATWIVVDTIPNSCSPDKPHMAIDLTSSPYRNSIYVAYWEILGPCPSNRINFSRIPAGETQFTNPISISGTTPQPGGANLAVGPEGQLYAVWSTRAGGEIAATGIGFTVSTNGGASFGDAIEITGLGVHGLGDYLKIASPIRVNSFPSMAVDTNECSPYFGGIYVAWADQRNGNPDIYFVRVNENGVKQGEPVLVNDDGSNTDQWMPWLTVDPNGIIHVVFYDSRDDPQNNYLTAVYMASSYNGGQSFAENVRISDVAFSPSPIDGVDYGYMGDYIGITSDDSHAYPCWNDNRTGIQQAYMAIVPTCDNLLTKRTIWSGNMSLDHDVVVCESDTLFIDNSATITISANEDRCPSPDESDPDKVGIVVYGTLWANGVSFVSDAGSPTSSDWDGIDVRGGGTLKLENCTIANAVDGVYASEPASVTIDHCDFHQNTRGVYIGSASSAQTAIKYCAFDQNLTSIDIQYSELVNAQWNVITNGANGILLNHVLSGVLERNVIDGMDSAGVKCYGSSGVATVKHNDILNCDVGVYEYVESSTTLLNNIVSGNVTGIQNIETSELKYNDVWGNGANYTNCGSDATGISGDPKFVDAGNGDYHLLSSSPCIDAGDPLSTSDPDQTRADIGAFYYPQGGGGGGGCPYVCTWDGSRYVVDNTILTESEQERRGGFVTDYYCLRQKLAADRGMYRLMIREFENERTELDALSLMVIDHPSETQVGVTTAGEVFLFKDRQQIVAARDHTSRDVLELISARDGDTYACEGSGSMLVTLAKTEGSRDKFVLAGPAPAGDTLEDSIIVNGQPPPEKKGNLGSWVRVDAEDARGNWLWGDQLPARGNPEDALWLLSPETGPGTVETRVRLRWLRGLVIDELAYYNVSSAPRTITPMNPGEATHSTQGAVQVALASRGDADFATLLPGENIDVRFNADDCPQLQAGWKRDFVLKSVGRYETLKDPIPSGFSLSQNEPNPFNSGTSIEYTLREPAEVTLRVYNLLGQLVSTLVRNKQEAGVHSVAWDGRDAIGDAVASGMYLYQIQVGGHSDTKKMILLK